MGESDPYLIEVKSSKKRDSRGRRQQREIEGLQKFFETDRAEMLRGMGPARRVSIQGAEVNHTEQLQSTIAEALKNGHSVARPEPGLYYVVFASGAPPVSEVLNSLPLSLPWLFSLNAVKNEQSWSPYLPFTLTIRDHDHLWAFIRGEIFIAVILDFDRLTSIARSCGISAQLDLEDRDYPLQITIPDMEAPAKVSSHILTRIGLEFISPNWLVTSSIEVLKKGAAIATAELG
jgi:hypothetical protein